VAGLRPPALALLVKRLPAAAVMGLDTDSLSHYVAICCFVGCEHSAKSIMARRPAVLTCAHSHGLTLLHIAVLTGARSVVQQVWRCNDTRHTQRHMSHRRCWLLPRLLTHLRARRRRRWQVFNPLHPLCFLRNSLAKCTAFSVLRNPSPFSMHENPSPITQVAQTRRCTLRAWPPPPTTNAALVSVAQCAIMLM